MTGSALYRKVAEDIKAAIAAGGYAAGTQQLLMRAVVLSTDGGRALRAHGSAPPADASQLGRDLAAELLRRGAADLISGQQAADEQQE